MPRVLILLEKETDGNWRMIQECILPADEAVHNELIHENFFAMHKK